MKRNTQAGIAPLTPDFGRAPSLPQTDKEKLTRLHQLLQRERSRNQKNVTALLAHIDTIEERIAGLRELVLKATAAELMRPHEDKQ